MPSLSGRLTDFSCPFQARSAIVAKLQEEVPSELSANDDWPIRAIASLQLFFMLC